MSPVPDHWLGGYDFLSVVSRRFNDGWPLAVFMASSVHGEQCSWRAVFMASSVHDEQCS